MFENVVTKRSRLSWFDISDRESCEKAIRNGGIAALVSAGVTAMFAIIGMNTTSERPGLAYLLDPSIIVDAVLLVILAFFVFRKSRTAATILFGYFVISKLIMWFELGAPKGLFIAALFFMLYLTAMRATYQWHSDFESETDAAPSGHAPPSYTSANASKPESLGVPLSFFIGFFVIVGLVCIVSFQESLSAWNQERGAWFLADVVLDGVSAAACLGLVFMIPMRAAAAPFVARLFFFVRGVAAAIFVIYVSLMAPDPFGEALGGFVAMNLLVLLISAIGFAYWLLSEKVQRLFTPKESASLATTVGSPATARSGGRLSPPESG
jgi:hypothetical protein